MQRGQQRSYHRNTGHDALCLSYIVVLGDMCSIPNLTASKSYELFDENALHFKSHFDSFCNPLGVFFLSS